MKASPPWLLVAVSLFPLLSAWSASPETEGTEARRSNYDALCEYQKTAEFSLDWPLEHRLDLNRDGVNESFLLFSEHAHFGTYSIFTRKQGSWVYMGQCDWGKWGPRLRTRRHHGWRDFAINISSTHRMITQDSYSWNSKTRQYDAHGWKTVREGNEE